MTPQDTTARLPARRRLPPRSTTGLTGSWLCSLEDPVQRWSPEMFEIFGTPDGFVPTPEAVLELVYPPDQDCVRRARAWWHSTGRPFTYQLRLVRPDGTRRRVQVRAWVDVDADGTPVRAIGTTRDITEEGRRRPSTTIGRQQAMLLESVTDGLCALDPEGRIVFANEGMCALLGLDDEPLDGPTLHDLVHRDSFGSHEHAPGACCYSGLPHRQVSGIDAAFTRADGTTLTVSYEAATEDGTSLISFRRVVDHDDRGALLHQAQERVRTLLAQRNRLLEEVTGAEERERLRIAADLHDDTIQALRAVALDLQTTRDALADDGARETLASAVSEVLDAATRLRHRMFDLMPPAVDDDLGRATDAYCRLLFAGTEIGWEVVGDTGPLRSDVYVIAYRLLQEALRNVLRHARATRTRIELSSARHTIVLRVLDDGIGWGNGSAAPLNGGMRLVDERARSAGGWARPGLGLDGRGASIEFVLPREGHQL